MFPQKHLEYNNEQCFQRGSCRDVIRKTAGARVGRVVRESVKERLSRCSLEPAGNEMSAEAEESQLLEAVTRERLVKTQQTEKT
jgi:hypothetical protein